MSLSTHSARTESFSGSYRFSCTWPALCLAVTSLAVAPALGQGQPTPPVFEAPVTFCTLGTDNEGNCISSRPMGLVVADFVDMPGAQDDGYPDVAVCNSDVDGQESVTVFHNTGDWSVPADALVRTGIFQLGFNTFPYEIKAADVTGESGDGDVDLIVTLYGSSQIVILENVGLGQFQPGVPIDISPAGRSIGEPRGLVVGDFDLDNRTDLAMAASDYDSFVGAVVLFWKQEDGSWHRVVLGEEHDMPEFAGTDIVSGAVAKKAVSPAFQDLVVAVTDFYQDPNLVTLVNLGQRQFASAIVSQAATEGDFTNGPMGIALGHFRTAVLQLDLVVADEFNYPPEGDSADVYWNDWFGNFGFQDEYLLQSGEQTGHDPYSVAVGKINGDTKQDFVCTIGHGDPCTAGGGIAVFVGYGDGTFREPPYLFCVDPDPSKVPKPKFVEIVDMDQDSFNDVVTSNNYDGHNISVLLNGLAAIPPGP